MAPVLRTYSRKNNSQKSSDAVNSLFAQNLCKRNGIKVNTKKIEQILKKLPSPDKNSSILHTPEPLKVRKDDTFDNLRDETFQQHVIYKYETSIKNSSPSENSKSVVSPSILPPSKVNKRKYRTLKPKIVVENTLDKSITLSLEVEIETKKKTLETLALTNSDIGEQSKVFQPVFSKSLYDDFNTRKVLMSSTPKVLLKTKKIVNETLSPIPTKSLFQQSLQQIDEWNSKPPDIKPRNIRKPTLRKRKINLGSSNDSINTDIKHTKSSKELNCIHNEHKELVVKIKALPDELVYRMLKEQRKITELVPLNDFTSNTVNSTQATEKVIQSTHRKTALDNSKISKSYKILNEQKISRSKPFCLDSERFVSNVNIYEIHSYSNISKYNNMSQEQSIYSIPDKSTDIFKSKNSLSNSDQIQSRWKTNHSQKSVNERNKSFSNSDEIVSDTSRSHITSQYTKNSNISDGTHHETLPNISVRLSGTVNDYSEINDTEYIIDKFARVFSNKRNYGTLPDLSIRSIETVNDHTDINETENIIDKSASDSSNNCNHKTLPDVSVRSIETVNADINETENIVVKSARGSSNNNIHKTLPDISVRLSETVNDYSEINETEYNIHKFVRNSFNNRNHETLPDVSIRSIETVNDHTDINETENIIDKSTSDSSKNSNHKTLPDLSIISIETVNDHYDIKGTKNIIDKSASDSSNNSYQKTLPDVSIRLIETVNDDSEINEIEYIIDKFQRNFSNNCNQETLPDVLIRSIKSVNDMNETENIIDKSVKYSSNNINYETLPDVSVRLSETINDSEMNERENSINKSARDVSNYSYHETLPDVSVRSSKTVNDDSEMNETVNTIDKSSRDSYNNDFLSKTIDDSVSSIEELDLRMENCNSVIIDIHDSDFEDNKHIARFQRISDKSDFLGWDGRMSDICKGSSIDSEKDELVLLKRIAIKPGKLYRRSMAVFKRETMDFWPISNVYGASCTCSKCKQKLVDVSLFRQSVRVVPEPSAASRDKQVTNNSIKSGKGYVPDSLQDSHSPIDKLIEDISVRSREVTNHSARFSLKDTQVFTARDVVLRRCGQTEPIPFSECYPNTLLKNCHKIGEGVYGEVFLFRNKKGTTSVMKVIPIEGDQIVNGERQKKFEEIISEIIIAQELSNLRNNTKNATTGFNEVHSIHCVKGKYPERLLELWDLYDEDKGSENDCPEIFTDDQLYVVLELANGGKDLESFVFNNAQQAYSLFKQTAFSLAVAETSLQFEHRDLHWGNILVSNTIKNSKLTYNLNGRQFDIATHGVEVSIIDFTLSRITADGVCIYNDLGQDPDLFNAEGDYQFEIYRLMQKTNSNDWQHFTPHTNILWLHYTLDKMITALRYKYTKTKCHATYIQKLQELKDTVLEYKSVEEFVTVNFV